MVLRVQKHRAGELLICSLEEWRGCNSTALHTIVELPPEPSWNLGSVRTVQSVGLGGPPGGWLSLHPSSSTHLTEGWGGFQDRTQRFKDGKIHWAPTNSTAQGEP